MGGIRAHMTIFSNQNCNLKFSKFVNSIRNRFYCKKVAKLLTLLVKIKITWKSLMDTMQIMEIMEIAWT